MRKNKKPRLVAIIGPTASGKSALAISIAKKFKGEIVSADSRQIYKGMDVGTAKPTKKEIATVKHHLIDIKNPNENYSAAEYKRGAIEAVDGAIERGKLPILVGGTGLYISAIVNNWEIPQIKENKKLRRKLEREIANKGLAFVFGELVKLDPEAAYIVDPKNPRRVIRALEIAILSGKKFSEQRKKGKPLYDVLEIGLNHPPKILKEKIIRRTKQMIKLGLINEIKNLIKKYGVKCKAFDAIGYREIIDYLKGKVSLEEATEQINKNTQRYAKRQMTWFKKYNPKTYWLRNKKRGIPPREKIFRREGLNDNNSSLSF